MLGILKGLATTFRTHFRRPVTYQYPDEHMPLAEGFQSFPVLLWDAEVGEPVCIGCQVCARNCPTECIKVTLKDNPKHKEGKSPRRKIVDVFELDYGACIVCGICVEVCNPEAIEMGKLHEETTYGRRDLVYDLERLLVAGGKPKDG